MVIDGEGDGEWVISLENSQALGRELLVESPNAVNDRVAAIQPDQLATLIYTSGTTGSKGCPAAAEVVDPYGCGDGFPRCAVRRRISTISQLPLSHSFGKVMLALPLVIGFPTVIDGRVDKIVDNSDCLTTSGQIRDVVGSR